MRSLRVTDGSGLPFFFLESWKQVPGKPSILADDNRRDPWEWGLVSSTVLLYSPQDWGQPFRRYPDNPSQSGVA